VHPILFRIGKVNVYSWGFMLAIAVIVAIFGISKMFEKEGYEKDTALDLIIITVLSGLLGARLLYVLIYQWDMFTNNPLVVFSLTNGGFSGLVWYGGFFGGLIAFVIYIWKKNLSFWKIADIFAPFTALGYGIVRIGCFLNGCCYGKVTDSAFGVVFPYVDAFPRHPTQLYSSAANILIFIFLMWYLPRKKFDGQIFLIYLMTYSIYRFVVEFFRANLVMYGPLSTSQTYSVVLFVAAVLLYWWRSS